MRDKAREVRAGRRPVHKMGNGIDPGTGQRFMELPPPDPEVIQKGEQSTFHPLGCQTPAIPTEIDIGKPDMGFVVESLRRHLERFECTPEIFVVYRSRCYISNPSTIPSDIAVPDYP